MTRLLLLVVALGALAQQPVPAPTPHGPYANREGWHCFRGETQEPQKLAHCTCELHCDEQGYPHEANDCQTYCDNSHHQCLCHTDENCVPERR